MLQIGIQDRQYNPTSIDSCVDRVNGNFGLDNNQLVDWPDRHLMGLYGKPVPFHMAQDIGYDSENRIIALIAGTQSGKALSVDTDIPTPHGFKKIREILPGDVVYDEMGNPCNVTKTTGIQLNRTCYKIIFDDGNEIITDADHLWRVQDYKQRKNQARRKPTNQEWIKNRPQCQATADYSILNTKQMFETMKTLDNRANYSVDICDPVNYPEKEFLIPSYTLGAWLGDGASKGAILYCTDEEIIQGIRRDGISISSGQYVENQGKAKTYKLGIVKSIQQSNGLQRKRNTFSNKLMSLDLINNKYIPSEYLFGSIDQRMGLLQGLMDTDGYANPKENGMCEFTSINKRLAYDVKILVQSLGIKVRLRTGRAMLNGKDYGEKYRVCFLADQQVFRVARKIKNQKPSKLKKKNTKRRYIQEIIPIESTPVKCITVDSPSSLYLCSDAFIPTHNTSWGPWWLVREIERTSSSEGSNDYIVITSSFGLFSLKLLPVMREVFEDILSIGRYWAVSKVIELRNPDTKKFEAKKANDKMWGRIILRSASSLGGLESATAKAAWLDEAGQDEFTLKAYQAIIRRLSLFRGRQLFTTTLYNLGWVKSQIIDIAKKGGKEYKHKIGPADLIHTDNKDQGITLVQYDSILNPEFSMEEFKDAESKMAEDEFKMFYKGLVARLRSVVYDCFDSEKHVVPAFAIPKEWPKGLLGIDPVGQITAAVWLAYDPHNGQLHLYREYEEPFGKTTRGHIIEILKFCQKDGEVLKVVGGGPGEKQARLDWQGSGLAMGECPITSLWIQIRKVYAILAENGLLIHDSCPRIISDLGLMKRKEDRHGNLTDTIEDKETWHLLDALRYIVGWLSAGEEREEVVYNRINIM